MLTLKTAQMVVTRTDNRVLSAAYSMQAVHIKFADNIEISIPCDFEDKSNLINRYMHMIMNSRAENITVDFTDLENLVSFA